MGKRLLQQRKGRQGSMLNKSVTTHKLGASRYLPENFAQRHGYQLGVVRELRHESGRAAPMAMLDFRSQVHKGKHRAIQVAVEGMFTGQTISMGKKASLIVGNVLPVKHIPEGCAISNIELKHGDGGNLCRAAGTFAIVIGHNQDLNQTRIKLPSGQKKLIDSRCRASVGQIASGGVIEPPLLKASAAYFKRKVKGKKSVRVTGMAKNAVEHPHGGGNHPHIGMPTTVSKMLSAGKKAQGHVGARMTGRRKQKTRR
ncbi:MAG: hypothetical protein MHPSP_002906 [Paramarteilia canceri]